MIDFKIIRLISHLTKLLENLILITVKVENNEINSKSDNLITKNLFIFKKLKFFIKKAKLKKLK